MMPDAAYASRRWILPAFFAAITIFIRFRCRLPPPPFRSGYAPIFAICRHYYAADITAAADFVITLLHCCQRLRLPAPMLIRLRAADVLITMMPCHMMPL